MKIGNHMSLLELQNLLHEQVLTTKIDFVTSAAAWRTRLNRSDEIGGKLWVGLGRTIGESLQNAYDSYERGD